MTPQLVSDLVCESKKKPEKLREKKQMLKEAAEQRSIIVATVKSIQDDGSPIHNVQTICTKIKEDLDIDVGRKLVTSVMRKDLGLSFVMAKKLHPAANSARSLVLRQQYAIKMLELLQQDRHVVNLDETWLNETSFVRRTWAPKNGRSNATLNAVIPRVSMIAAMDTDGRVWFTLSHAATDSNIMALFLERLTQALHREAPGFEQGSVFLYDGAPYHTGADTRAVIKKLGLTVIQSGPYSFSGAPIELLFSALKFNELNEGRLPTGKRSLHLIRNMVVEQLRRVPVSQRAAYWHHSTGHLYRYVSLQKI